MAGVFNSLECVDNNFLKVLCLDYFVPIIYHHTMNEEVSSEKLPVFIKGSVR